MRKFTEENYIGQVIYVLINKSKRTFIIAKGTTETLRETYRHHLRGRRLFSQEFIQSTELERPCLFVLEEIPFDEKANLLLVWLRILRENGYISFNGEDIIEQSEILYIDNNLAYQKRKNSDLEELFSCKNCVIPTYKKKMCVQYPVEKEEEKTGPKEKVSARIKRKRNQTIHLRMDDEEMGIIRRWAADQTMSVTNYLRLVAKNPIIRNYNYDVVRKHTQEIAQLRNSINNLIFTIEVTNNFLPQEITEIVKIMGEIFNLQNELLRTIREKNDEYEEEM